MRPSTPDILLIGVASSTPRLLGPVAAESPGDTVEKRAKHLRYLTISYNYRIFMATSDMDLGVRGLAPLGHADLFEF